MNRIALILSAACFGRGRGQHPTHEVLRFDPDYDQFVDKVIGAMRQASDLCGLTLENLRARVSRRVAEDATFYVRTGSACRERLQLTQCRHAARPALRRVAGVWRFQRKDHSNHGSVP